MAKTLNKEERKRLEDAITVPKEIEAGIVTTTGSFAAVGKTPDLAVIMGAALQTLVEYNVFDKDIIDILVSNIDYNKRHKDSKKELVEKFMKAFNIDKEEIEEVLNEEE